MKPIKRILNSPSYRRVPVSRGFYAPATGTRRYAGGRTGQGFSGVAMVCVLLAGILLSLNAMAEGGIALIRALILSK